MAYEQAPYYVSIFKRAIKVVGSSPRLDTCNSFVPCVRINTWPSVPYVTLNLQRRSIWITKYASIYPIQRHSNLVLLRTAPVANSAVEASHPSPAQMPTAESVFGSSLSKQSTSTKILISSRIMLAPSNADSVSPSTRTMAPILLIPKVENIKRTWLAVLQENRRRVGRKMSICWVSIWACRSRGIW